MSSITKTAQSVLDHLLDKVASLKASGKFKEAEEAEREYARVSGVLTRQAEEGVSGLPVPAGKVVDRSPIIGVPDGYEFDPTAPNQMRRKRSAPDEVGVKPSANVVEGEIVSPGGQALVATGRDGPGDNFLDAEFFDGNGLPAVQGKGGLPYVADGSGVTPSAMKRQTFGAAGLLGLGTAGAAGLYSTDIGPEGVKGKPGAAVQDDLMAKAKPTEAGGKGGDTSPPKPQITYQKVKNYLEGLGSAPEFDATDFNKPLDRNQVKAQDAAKGLKDQIDDLMAANKAATDGLAKRELTEKIIQGVGLLFAGMHGLSTGQDLSGVKFEKTDWAQKAAAEQQKLGNDLMAAKEKYKVDEDVLNKERQLLKDNKDDGYRAYADAYRKWDSEAGKLKYKTDYEQQERGYKDSLARWEADMVERAEKAAGANDPKKQIESLAKERETEIDSVKKQWRLAAAGLPKLKGDAKDSALENLKMMDEQITAMTGVGMLPNQALYEEPKQFVGGIDYEDVLTKANEHQNQIMEKAKADPKLMGLLQQRNTVIEAYTMQAQAKGLSLRDADAQGRAAYRKALDRQLNTPVVQKGK